MSFRLATNSEKEQFDKMAVHPLQTWEWGEFRRKAGNDIIRFVNAHKKNLIDSYTLIIHKLPFGKYKIGTLIKCPHPTRELFPFLKKIAIENNLIFIKLEPNVIIDPKFKGQNSKLQLKNKNEWTSWLQNYGCVRGKTLFTPTSFWIDLTKSESDLLKSFSSKTRYNIRLAEKHGVKVTEDNSSEAFEKYLQLTFETAHRQGFYAHTQKYHKLMWKYLNLQPTTYNLQPVAHLLTAKYEGEIITTWILFVWKDFLYYPYGASSDKHKNVMANNLVMWEAIKLGKKMGLTTFDLWGREEGKGFTKFKEGYNPQVVEFLGSWDFIVNKPLYYCYRIVEYLRWKILKLPAWIKHKLSK
ncbi:MAG: FemAB family protein [Candidatus Woesebacteria bacterium GW2011_GWA1_39_21]|uniref:FemAB family protein n=1 Tax=Candidatus Woesebacteria bacterium GW2011_GWA1_39_21 TaxID=1618550 RepID=A0A0G0RDG8_9BACT|nr:MAG: FemAB family protein [Candidatus Woesebacteria bacterium GW2011_GWA1_39_21]